MAFERVPVPKVYHPFISGPDNQSVRELMERTGVKIMVPPHSVDKDEIVVSGEKDGVLEAKKFILAVFDEKVNCSHVINSVNEVMLSLDSVSLVSFGQLI